LKKGVERGMLSGARKEKNPFLLSPKEEEKARTSISARSKRREPMKSFADRT